MTFAQPTRRIRNSLHDAVPANVMRLARRAICAIVLVCVWGGPLAAQEYRGTLRVTHSLTHRGLLNVDAKGASLRETLAAVQVHVEERIVLTIDGDRRLHLTARNQTPREVIRRAAKSADLQMVEIAGSILLTDPLEPVLHLNVKNAPVREILASVRHQCGIRNLIIDPEVAGQGTFLFAGVPCVEGLRVILASLGLAADIEPGLVRVKGTY